MRRILALSLSTEMVSSAPHQLRTSGFVFPWNVRRPIQLDPPSICPSFSVTKASGRSAMDAQKPWRIGSRIDFVRLDCSFFDFGSCRSKTSSKFVSWSKVNQIHARFKDVFCLPSVCFNLPSDRVLCRPSYSCKIPLCTCLGESIFKGP